MTESTAKVVVEQQGILQRLKSVGPALVVAAVVLGPGSIFTSSVVGAQFGTGMLWLLLTASILMIGTTALAAWLGSSLKGTIGDELAGRLGRPFAAIIGIVLFLVVVGFQSSNNAAVLAGLEPLQSAVGMESQFVDATVLVVINVLLIFILLQARDVYRFVESAMKVCILLMVLAFAANFIAASPALSAILGGLIPSFPPDVLSVLVPTSLAAVNSDPLKATQGMIATTFSIAGAFYQAYLVRERGWTQADARTGLFDSVVGILALGTVSAMIMLTSATVLHGKVDPSSLESAADVARQLEPVFGSWATVLFSVGIFAGALSSFLVNAMIGGTLLADGFGKGSSAEDRGPCVGTVAALLAGMVIAIATSYFGKSKVNAIIIAQALTVLGGPVLSGSLLYLAHRSEGVRVPKWVLALAWIGFVVVLALAGRTALQVWFKLVG